MESGSVIRDGVGITCMGYPNAPYPFLGSRSIRSIDLGDRLASPRWRFYRWALQTFPGKVEGCLRVTVPHFPCPSYGSGGPCLGHIPQARQCSVGQARPVSQATSRRMSFRISIGGTRGFFLPSLRLSFTTAASSSFFLLSTFVRYGGF